MASIDIDDMTFRQIADLAASKNRTPEAEAADILRSGMLSNARSKSLREIADGIAALTEGVTQTDSVELLREDRER